MLPCTEVHTRAEGRVRFGLIRRYNPPSSASSRLPAAKTRARESPCGAVPPAPLEVIAVHCQAAGWDASPRHQRPEKVVAPLALGEVGFAVTPSPTPATRCGPPPGWRSPPTNT